MDAFQFEVGGRTVAYSIETVNAALIEHEKDEQGEDLRYVHVPVVKATTKGAPASIEVCWDHLPGDVMKEAIVQGLKVIINRGAGPDSGANKATEEGRETAMKLALANVQKLYEGKIRMTAASRTKVSGALKTEAMRIARAIIRDAIKDSGAKISHYKPKAISEAAAKLLESERGKEVWAAAKKALEERAKEETGLKKEVSGLIAGLQPDEELVKKAKAKAKKAEVPADLIAGAAAKKGAPTSVAKH